MPKSDSYVKRTEKYLIPLMEEKRFDLVDVEFLKEAGTWYLRVYIDKEGGVTIDDCEMVSRQLDRWLDEEDFIDESYVLEVSSPGLSRPLKKDKDLARSLGRDVELKLYKALKGRKEFSGVLCDFDEDSVTIRSGDGGVRKFGRKDIATLRLALDF